MNGFKDTPYADMTLNEFRSLEPVSVIGVILTGGRSSRMRTNKALLEIQGERLVDRIRRVLYEALSDSSQNPAQVLLSGELDGYPCIADQTPQLGPLGGIVSVYHWIKSQALKPDYLLIVPVDMPGLSSELLRQLANFPLQCDSVCFENHSLPLRLRNCSRALDVLTELFKESQMLNSPSIFSLQRLHQRLQGTQLIPTSDDQYQLINFNTPEDWQRYQNETINL